MEQKVCTQAKTHILANDMRVNGQSENDSERWCGSQSLGSGQAKLATGVTSNVQLSAFRSLLSSCLLYLSCINRIVPEYPICFWKVSPVTSLDKQNRIQTYTNLLEPKEPKLDSSSRSATPIPSRPTTPKPLNGVDQQACFRSGMLTIRIFSGKC
jgi:hypothetical protein